MKRGKLLTAALAGMAVIMLLTACGGQDTNSPADTGAAPAEGVCPPETEGPAETGDETGATPVWKFCHGRREGLETAEITVYLMDCEEGPIPQETTDEEKEAIRDLAMNGVVTGKENDMAVTGGTWAYSFQTPEGEYLLSIELYQGLIVSSDGMYSYHR